MHRFSAKLLRFPGKGGWTFARVPKKWAPPVTHGWGRTPVRAVVDGYAWQTSVWRDKKGMSMLPVPQKARGTKGHGDTVRIEITFDKES